MSERLRELIKALGETQSSFAERVGTSQSTIATAIMRGTRLSTHIMGKIIKAYPQINLDWLLTGEGCMFIEEKTGTSFNIKKLDNGKFKYSKWIPSSNGNLKLIRSIKEYNSIEECISDAKNIKLNDIDKNYDQAPTIPTQEETRPRIPLNALAGVLTESVSDVIMSDCEQIPVIKIFPQYDFTILVKGDSMCPRYESGDEIACKRISGSNFIQWGKVHVLDTTQGILIKRIYDAGDNIRCNSYNTDYPDFEIPKKEIYSISLVVGLLRM